MYVYGLQKLAEIPGVARPEKFTTQSKNSQKCLRHSYGQLSKTDILIATIH